MYQGLESFTIRVLVKQVKPDLIELLVEVNGRKSVEICTDQREVGCFRWASSERYYECDEFGIYSQELDLRFN